MRELSEQEIDLVAGGPVAAAPHAAPLALIDQGNLLSSAITLSTPGLFPAIGGMCLANDPFAIAK
jgi:hypothetical protein